MLLALDCDLSTWRRHVCMLTLLLEKEKAAHSSTLAWRIPWMEELDGLQSAGHKVLDTTERLRFHFALL